MPENRKLAPAAVQQAVDEAVSKRGEIGVQVAAYHRGRLIVDSWAGLADRRTDTPVDGGTLFNVFSVTKGVTATAVHLQAERGRLEYDAPMATYWPEFGANGKETVTVRNALTHCTGAPQMPPGVTPEMMCDWEQMASAIAALPPILPIGEPAYQSMSFGWVLGELVRRTDPFGRSFARFVEEEIAAPYSIDDLWIGIDPAAEPRIAHLVDDMGTGPLPEGSLIAQSLPAAVALGPQVFDRPDVRRAPIAGVGGIFTARALARFFAILAGGGRAGWEAAAVARARRDDVPPSPRRRQARPGILRIGDADQRGRILAIRSQDPQHCADRIANGDLRAGGRGISGLGRSRQRTRRRVLPQPDVIGALRGGASCLCHRRSHPVYAANIAHVGSGPDAGMTGWRRRERDTFPQIALAHLDHLPAPHRRPRPNIQSSNRSEPADRISRGQVQLASRTACKRAISTSRQSSPLSSSPPIFRSPARRYACG
jgi:CubicO group peptidase (beta-lactamase class C family)